MSSSPPIDGLLFLSDTRPLRERAARWRLPTLCAWLSLVECAVALLTGIAATLLMPGGLGEMEAEPGVLAAIAAAFVLRRTGRLAGARRLRLVVLAGQLLAAGAAGAAVLALHGTAARAGLAWAAGTVLVTGLLVAALRTAFAKGVALLLADGRLATHIAVVGLGPAAARTMARLHATDPHLVHVVGQYAAAPDAVPGAGPVRGSLRTLLSDCRLGLVDMVVLATEPGDPAQLNRLQAALRPCAQQVYLVADLIAEAPDTARVFAFGTTPLMLVGEPPIRGWSALGKRLLDQLGALLLLVALAAVMLAVAAAIRLETPGPVLFRQLRVGYNNRLFYMYKFRSMHAGATDRLAKQQTVRGDRRVTRVGRVIRRLSLDELPQLLNVLRGEMSLVGPRPHAPGTSVRGQRIHTLVDGYDCRHLVRPGITGLAQVRGLRGGLEDRDQVADRLAADLEYIRAWSPWLDLKILVGTLAQQMRGSRGC